MRTAQTAILAQIADRKALDDDIVDALRAATDNFKAGSDFAARPPAATTAGTTAVAAD